MERSIEGKREKADLLCYDKGPEDVACVPRFITDLLCGLERAISLPSVPPPALWPSSLSAPKATGSSSCSPLHGFVHLVQLACLFLTSQRAGVLGCWVANSGLKKKMQKNGY